MSSMSIVKAMGPINVCLFLQTVFMAVPAREVACQSGEKDSICVQVDTVKVFGTASARQSVERTFTAGEIRSMPGNLGDPVRALDLSAEVVSNSDLQAIPIIGGDEANAILTLIDGFPITYPYRLLGSFSLFNPLTTKQVDLMTEGYPVSYGGYAPTAIGVKSKSEFVSRPAIETDLSMFVSSALVQIPISDSLRWSAGVAARASNVRLAADLLSGPSQKRLEGFIPNLRDIQFYTGEMPSTNLYSFQECLVSQESGSLASANRTFDYSWEKEFAGVAVLTSSDRFTSEHRLSWTHDLISLSTFVPIEFIGNGRFGINSQFTTVRLQDQFQFPLFRRLDLTIGSDLLYSVSEVGFETFDSWLNEQSPLRSNFPDFSVFAELRWRVLDNGLLTLGGRATHFGFINSTGFEPRGTFVYDISERSTVKFTLGQYLQCPSDFEILHGFLMFIAVPDQTPLMMLMSEHRGDLRLETNNLASINFTTSVIQSSSTAVTAGSDLYFKQTQSLIMPARYPGVFTPLDTMSFEPLQAFEGIKWGIGISSSLILPSYDLTVTGSVFSHHSRIIDEQTGNQYLTIGDRPLVGKLVLEYSPPGWTLSLLYQYSTGSPTTDEYFLKGSNLVGEVVYLPVWNGLNSSRVPDYHRLDFTAAKSWRGVNWRVELVCNMLNLLSNTNISNYNYAFSSINAGYVRKTPVMNSLPFVPNLEIRCEYSL